MAFGTIGWNCGTIEWEVLLWDLGLENEVGERPMSEGTILWVFQRHSSSPFSGSVERCQCLRQLGNTPLKTSEKGSESV